MTDTRTIVDRYLAIWNEGDAKRRRALIAAAWTEDATYVDPVMRGAGHEGIDAMISGAQAQFPGFEFRALGRDWSIPLASTILLSLLAALLAKLL